VTLPTKSPNLRVHHIHKDRLRFMVSTRNPLAHRTKITLEEVAAQPLIFPKTGFTRQVLDKLFRPYRSRIRISMELPSIGMIKRFVAADAGVSFISESFAKDYVKAGEVKLLTVEGVDLWRELGLVYRRIAACRALRKLSLHLFASIKSPQNLPAPRAQQTNSHARGTKRIHHRERRVHRESLHDR
jgi:DNA-binding transcriptional LysR family regulator